MPERRYHLQLLEAIAASTEDAIFALDADCRIVYLNPAAERAVGRELPEVAGCPESELFPAEYAAGLNIVNRRVIASGRSETAEENLPGVDGVRTYHVIRSPLRDETGRIIGLCGIAHDITARKQAEQALADRESRLANVLLTTREAVWDCDLKTGRVSHNRRWCELLGFDVAMLEHSVQVYYDLIHPADRAAVRQRIDAALATCDEYSAEYRLRRGDGHYFWVADHGRVIARAADGTPLRILGAFADIGRRKAAQEQLEAAKQQLHALAARLQAVREEERSRIAGEVHDEFGQLITALSLDLAGLGKRIRKVGDASLRGEMEQRMDDIDALMQQMLGSVVEIASELRPQVLDNLGLPAAIRFEAERFEARTGIACQLAVPDELPDLPANCATALFRIFQEALTNVARHGRATQVAITLARTGSGSVVLGISDNGRGITADELAAPDALGLLGMRERAAQLGGSVEIAGRPGQGTTVTVMLP